MSFKDVTDYSFSVCYDDGYLGTHIVFQNINYFNTVGAINFEV